MTIFNSLGSNYNLNFALQTLFSANNKKYSEQLNKFLEDKYQGEVALVYKGREALRLALRVIGKKGKTVAISGFTCFAVYDAVTKEGYIPEYLDIEKNSLNFSFETLKNHVSKNPELKVVVVQNTLGNPCDIEKIAKFCKEKNIILIEDLAHSIGSVYKNGEEAGMVGDFTVLSFSQDKVVDGISGGALIIKNQESRIKNQEFNHVKFNKQIVDRLYPLFTFSIRKTYGIGIGKGLHFILKKLNLLSNPMGDSGRIYFLSNWYCNLVYKQFKNLEKDIFHRKKIANIYSNTLDKKIIKFDLDISKSTNIRFPIIVENRNELIKYLKECGVFVSDIWYDAPIAPKKYFHKTNYNNECPNSEFVSAKILNLPTHRNVSEKDAEYISKKINQWIISK